MKTTSGPVRVAVFLIAIICMPFSVKAQTRLYFESRYSYDYAAVSGNTVDGSCGFHGRNLTMRFDGQLSENLSFSYRQKFNSQPDAFFDTVDWLHLDWQVSPEFSLSAGKQVVAIGGLEYDRAPIDLYYCSEFWWNIPCYQIGVSASYNVSDSDRLVLQFCNSPMRGWTTDNRYALNLMWYGKHGFWKTMWSANAIQCEDDCIYYLALGNRFTITDWLRLDLDVMDRYTPGTGAFDDMSLMSEMSAEVAEDLRLYGKYTHDRHLSSEGIVNRDYVVLPGTDIQMVSGGVEYHPLHSSPESLKLFAMAGYSWGANSNPNGVLTDKSLKFQIGMKFRLDVLGSLSSLKQ